MPRILEARAFPLLPSIRISGMNRPQSGPNRPVCGLRVKYESPRLMLNQTLFYFFQGSSF